MPPGQKHTTANLVWYASYGSNLKLERFMCYIKGGAPKRSTSTRPYVGCRNKSDPKDSRPISLRFELYFAGRSVRWGNGGIAFIRQNPERGPTLGRMYLITDEQFNDVGLQENGKTPDGNRYVPIFEELVSRQELTVDDNSLYGRILNIGSEEACPILTFTTDRHLTLNLPNENYLKEIAAGIKETYPQMSNDDISEYLLRADGVRGRIDLTDIKDWVAVA